jgi:hypothetical protein
LEGVLRGGFFLELPINTVQQFLNFAILVTLRIIRAVFHGASLRDETSERKGLELLLARFVNVVLQPTLVIEIEMFRQLRSPWPWHPSTNSRAANPKVQSKPTASRVVTGHVFQ